MIYMRGFTLFYSLNINSKTLKPEAQLNSTLLLYPKFIYKAHYTHAIPSIIKNIISDFDLLDFWIPVLNNTFSKYVGLNPLVRGKLLFSSAFMYVI